jgi:hypothetical protein
MLPDRVPVCEETIDGYDLFRPNAGHQERHTQGVTWPDLLILQDSSCNDGPRDGSQSLP